MSNSYRIPDIINHMQAFHTEFPYVIEATSMAMYLRSKDWANTNLGPPVGLAEFANDPKNNERLWTTFGLSVRVKRKEDYFRMRLSVE